MRILTISCLNISEEMHDENERTAGRALEVDLSRDSGSACGKRECGRLPVCEEPKSVARASGKLYCVCLGTVVPGERAAHAGARSSYPGQRVDCRRGEQGHDLLSPQ